MLTDKLPLWYQIAQQLRAEILEHHGEEPQRLPTEEQLARRFNVALVTVRQALASIQEENLILRRRRHGTFTNPQAFPKAQLKLLGSIEAVFAQQASEETRVLERDPRHPVPIALRRCFPQLKHVHFFRRLRCERGEPLSYALNYVLPEYGRRISAHDLKHRSMTKALRDAARAPIHRIDNSVEARLPSTEVVRALTIEALAPVLVLTGTSYDTADRVVDHTTIWYRADRYRFSVSFDFET